MHFSFSAGRSPALQVSCQRSAFAGVVLLLIQLSRYICRKRQGNGFYHNSRKNASFFFIFSQLPLQNLPEHTEELHNLSPQGKIRRKQTWTKVVPGPHWQEHPDLWNKYKPISYKLFTERITYNKKAGVEAPA